MAKKNKNTDAAKRAARKNAIDLLIAAHPDEFEALMKSAHEERGVTWNRRLTPEERAERDAKIAEEKAEAKARREAERAQRDLDRLLERHPDLRKRVLTDPPA